MSGGPVPSKMFALEAPSPSLFLESSAACHLGPAWKEVLEEGGGARDQGPLTTQQQAQRTKAQVKGLPEEWDRVSWSTQHMSQRPQRGLRTQQWEGQGQGTVFPEHLLCVHRDGITWCQGASELALPVFEKFLVTFFR